MAGFVETPCRTFEAGAAIARHLRVKLSSGVLAAAGASDISLGTLEEASLASGDKRAVRLRTAPGTKKMVAAAAITAGNPVYAAASGKVDASGSIYEGLALEAATANGDVIEVLQLGQSDAAGSQGGTTAAAFEVDSDSAIPKIALASYVGGTGDYTTTLKPEATLSADNTITVPEADGDTLVAVALAQTLTSKTLTSPVVNTPTLNLTAAALAAAGSAQGDAGAIVSASGAFIHATAADGTKGIVLPAATAGQIFFIKNSDAANAVLKVYPATGDAINALSANSALSMAAKTAAVFIALDTTTWYTISLLPS